MKKTGFVWFVIIVGSINTLLMLFGLLMQSNESVINIVVSVITVLISLVYLYKLFLMKSNLRVWTNIFFGLNIFASIFSVVSIYISSGGINPTSALISNGIVVAAVILIWVLFYKHIVK